MLLIQAINLTWDKNERGATGENVRRQFPLAYPLAEKQFGDNVIVHSLNFFQEGTIFMDAIQEVRHSMNKHLPRLGFTQNRIQREIQERILWIKKYQYQSYRTVNELNLVNLSICCKDDKSEVTFLYDEQRSGKPFRRGHNKDFQNPDSPFYRKDNLNETAFTLSPNQYGRIIWNERRKDYDLGTWFYQLHIYNLVYASSTVIENDIFVKSKPDYEYKQLASLYY